MLQAETLNPLDQAHTTCCFSTVEDWVARHSRGNPDNEQTYNELDYPQENGLPTDHPNNSTGLSYEDQEFLNVKFGNCSSKMTLSEIYLFAQAKRKAREKEFNEESSGDTRSSMLRKAYAAQREFTASLQSDFSANSVETKSSVEWLLNCRETDPEELLLSLGFGGPSQGIERIPKRFLQPSKLYGVEIDKFFQLQQELADVCETGSLGYRGLSGPPTRRPSTIVSRILEKMREQQKDEYKRKQSATAQCIPAGTSQTVNTIALPSEEPCPVIEEHKEESCDVLEEPTIILGENHVVVKPQSTLSSRRSSLRKQDRVEEWDDDVKLNEPPTDDSAPLSEKSDSSGFHGSNTQRDHSNDSTAISETDTEVNCDEEFDLMNTDGTSSHDRRPDPVLAILRLAVETYKSQLRLPIPIARPPPDSTDCNHNSIELRAILQPEPPDLLALREELYRQLKKTESLLQKYEQIVDSEAALGDLTISATITQLANDMSVLLEKQQSFNEQLRDVWPVEIHTVHDREDETKSSASSRKPGTKSRKVTKNASEVLTRPWLRSFERRICSQVRQAVRREVRKALTAESLTFPPNSTGPS